MSAVMPSNSRLLVEINLAPRGGLRMHYWEATRRPDVFRQAFDGHRRIWSSAAKINSYIISAEEYIFYRDRDPEPDQEFDPDRHQNLITWFLGHPTPPKISTKPLQNFLNNLADNKQTDRQTDPKTLPFFGGDNNKQGSNVTRVPDLEAITLVWPWPHELHDMNISSSHHKLLRLHTQLCQFSENRCLTPWTQYRYLFPT